MICIPHVFICPSVTPVLWTVDISGTLRAFVFALFVTDLVTDLVFTKKSHICAHFIEDLFKTWLD